MNWKKLGEIVSQVDGGCPSCARFLTGKIANNFKDFDKEEFKKGLLSTNQYWVNSEDVSKWFILDEWDILE